MLYYKWLGTELDAKLRDKIEVYTRGTQTREVVDTDYYMGDITFNDKVMANLKCFQGQTHTIENGKIIDYLQRSNFKHLKHYPLFDGYLLKSHFYPFLINEATDSKYLVPPLSPAHCPDSIVMYRKSTDGFSVSTLQPFGTEESLNFMSFNIKF